jgi:hypothetical protein
MLTRRSLLRGTAALPLAAALSGVWKWLGGCKPEAKFASHLTDGTTISTFHSNSDPPTGHDYMNPKVLDALCQNAWPGPMPWMESRQEPNHEP